jgi:hemoglobin
MNTAHVTDLVDRFYDKVRLDPSLGPVFNNGVSDWVEHKRTLVLFWCSVALQARSYRGNPLAAHRRHPIHAEHFSQWTLLWRETCREVMDDPDAVRMIEYAERIGRSLRYGLSSSQDSNVRSLGVRIAGNGH